MHLAVVFHNEELVYYENGTEKWRGSMSARVSVWMCVCMCRSRHV